MDAERLRSNLRAVEERIGAARRRSPRATARVTLVAVTKYVGAEVLPLLAGAGATVIGENRVQDALAKRAAVGDCGLEWHLIGTLQRNKINKVLGAFSLLHAVDSAELARGLSERTTAPQPVLFEVNVSGETSKSGFTPEELRRVFPELLDLPGIVPRGLMTMAPLADDPEAARPVFAALRALRDELRERYALAEFDELSMGMSGDFETAVEEGATLVRVGSALYRDSE